MEDETRGNLLYTCSEAMKHIGQFYHDMAHSRISPPVIEDACLGGVARTWKSRPNFNFANGGTDEYN